MKEIRKEIIKEINDILLDLDATMHSIDTSGNNNKSLITISANHKNIQEVIQYFTETIDSVRTQNEALRDILTDIIKNMLLIKKKLIDEIYFTSEIEQLKADIEKLKDKSAFQKSMVALNENIPTKVLIIIISASILAIIYIFKPSAVTNAVSDTINTKETIQKAIK